MKFGLDFIKEFLDINVPPEELALLLTMAGMEVEHLEKAGKDWIFDIEVTTNRYDWLSILGIAREISAALGRSLNVKYPSITKDFPFKERNIIIENNQDCPYYVGRIIKGVKVDISCGIGRYKNLNNGPYRKEAQGKNSEWPLKAARLSCAKLRRRILNCGISSVNNIVDITNYCMLKWGNPLHVFDNDKIEGNIYIRKAKEGEPFTGIDNRQRNLKEDNLVIADDKKVIALAGIMGAKNTEVNDNTKNIFLEAAIFSPIAVRYSRRSAGLDTESSYRFERRVSPVYLEYASYEAAKLIEKSAEGILSGCRQAGKKPSIVRKKITIDIALLNAHLGVPFSPAKVKKILTFLDFNVQNTAGGKLLVLPPACRFDIKREVDIYEEFARIYGYEKIPPQIPFLACRSGKDLFTTLEKVHSVKDLSLMGFTGKNQLTYCFKNDLRKFIALLGFKEIITYSIEGGNELDKIEEKGLIKILNPLRKQENALRNTLFLGMIKSMRHNFNRGQSSLCFFEIADIYFKGKKSFSEMPELALGISKSGGDFFYLKRAVEVILNYLNIDIFEFKQGSLKNFTNALMIIIDGRDAGFLGKLDEAVKKNFDLKEDLFFARLDLLSLVKKKDEKKYKSFSSYPIVWRDVSISLREDVKFKEAERIIRDNNDYLTDLRIVDVYKGKDISPNHSAFTLRIFYKSDKGTLTSQAVDSFHKNVRDKLNRKDGIVLR